MSMPKISELHASFIWVESAPSLPGKKAPMAYLGNRQAFIQHFETMQDALNAGMQPAAAILNPTDRAALATHLGSPAQDADTLDALHWALPWEMGQHVYKHHFWNYYLGKTDPRFVSGENAWTHLVPLRLRLPLRVAGPGSKTGGPAVRIFTDGYAYPHGSAVELKLQVDYGESGVLAPLALSDLLQFRSQNIAVRLPDGTPQQLKLQALAEHLLGFLRGLVWGDTASLGDFKMATDPLWIVTIVKGWMVDDDLPVVSGSDLHRVLNGFCTFAPNWATVNDQNLAQLDKANLLIGNSSGGRIGSQTAGHLVYHGPRSRLVWLPTYFKSVAPRLFMLSCYHRNLALLSLHTEMLAKAMFVFDGSPKKPAALKKLASAAAQRLAELYASEKDKTYVSASPRAYLDEMGYTPKINAILPGLKLPPLNWTPWGAATAGVATPAPGG
jgi:hypothetical protein